MDEYSKTGPRSARAAVIQREREKADLMKRLLQAESEERFTAMLKDELKIRPDHPNYTAMLQMWRSQHAQR